MTVVAQAMLRSRRHTRTSNGELRPLHALRAPVKFVARGQLRQVIANVYVDGRLDRVEHFHATATWSRRALRSPAA